MTCRNDWFVTLESRRLMSAVIDSEGVLVVTGDSGKNNIIISLKENDASKLVVRVDKETSEFNLADITTGIRVSAQGGKDKIAVDETSGAMSKNVTIYGGNGKDDIYGGSGNDKLDGGTGKDRIFGRSGNDRIIGHSGNDLLEGDDGNDYITGDAGVDTLVGGAGDDDLNGGGSHDHITGSAGNDDYIDFDAASERKDDAAEDDGDNGLLDQSDQNPLA
jgi:Ca2+-binding RTX toxin-like protein